MEKFPHGHLKQWTQIIPNKHLAHGGPHKFDEKGVCFCGHEKDPEDEIEMIDPDVWDESKRAI